MHEKQTTSPPLIEWDAQSFAVGIPDMDETHRHFVDLFTRLLEHTQAHFEDEEARMLLCDFPAIADHTGEHRRVLGEFTQIKRQVDKGLISFGRCYVREGLPGWFRLHVATMDSALAAHWNHYEERSAPVCNR